MNDRYQTKGITAYSLHPGIVQSNLQSHDTSVIGTISRMAMKIVPTSSAVDGARTSLYCATSLKAIDFAGLYMVPFGKVDNRANRWLNDAKAVDRLWELANNQLKNHGFATDF
jgi:hypothetical protein